MSVRNRLIVAISAIALLAWACSGKAKYPRCNTDRDCATAGKHDYCVSGACAYCRTALDCGDREMCRAGGCLADPDLQVRDGGDDAAPDASGDDDAEALPPHPSTRRRRIDYYE